MLYALPTIADLTDAQSGTSLLAIAQLTNLHEDLKRFSLFQKESGKRNPKPTGFWS